MNDIVNFDLIRINRGREKLCKCVAPRLEIDTENRIVLCQKCGAILDPFEALMKLAEYPEKMVEAQKQMKERIRAYKEEAEQERTKMIKSKVFRDMQQHYNAGLLPYCPECQKKFDPTRIKEWSR